jgi:hypothetical protein
MMLIAVFVLLSVVRATQRDCETVVALHRNSSDRLCHGSVSHADVTAFGAGVVAA